MDFDQRAEDKTNSNILILGNSGEGKSYLMKLILTNLRESGRTILLLDPDEEYQTLTRNLGGCYTDLMGGEYRISVMQPKSWEDNGSVVSQHISFLRDFFRSYKDFSDGQIDTLEIMCQNLSDFLLPGIAEYAKPLFAIPTHSFLFYPGSIAPAPFMDMLQLEESEYELIKYPQRGVCLFRCGNERFNLRVIAPGYKAKLFGTEGGV